MSEFLTNSVLKRRFAYLAPWRLLDFAEKIDETHLKGLKSFAVNEEFFVGHFPTHPIVPGVLHVEAIRQLCLHQSGVWLSYSQWQPVYRKFCRPVC